MLQKQGNIIRFMDDKRQATVVRIDRIEVIWQYKNGNIGLGMKSGAYTTIPVEEYITFDDVVTKIFF